MKAPGEKEAKVVLRDLAGLLLAAVIGGAAWGSFLQFGMAPKDIAPVLGAIATTTAVIVALWNSLDAKRASARAALARAAIAAARHLPNLQVTKARLSVLCARFDFDLLDIDLDDRDALRAGQLDLLEFAVTDLEKIVRNELTMDEIVELAALPNHVSARIAAAYSSLEEIAGYAADWEDTRQVWARMSHQGRNHRIKAWAERVHLAHAVFHIACIECERVADIHAPRPTEEELYGQFE